MLEQFLNHLRQQKLCRSDNRILLAVSGGVDSMVMLHLFGKAGFAIGVAHVNFQLREEANSEEIHVRAYCEINNIPFFSKRFDTQHYASEKSVSIQVAARELRYQFFAEVSEQHSFDRIATAHHADDNLETVLLNLIRGTGLDGLAGIPVRSGKIIRPLLFASRDEIMRFALDHGIPWKEDSSNATDHYRRNFLRNNVIPLLKDVNPNLIGSFSDTLRRVKGARSFAMETIDAFVKEAVIRESGQTRVNIKLLNRYEFADVLLWEIVKEFGFSFSQCRDMVSDHQTGRQFIAKDYCATIDRDFLLLHSSNSPSFTERLIGPEQSEEKMGDNVLQLRTRANVDFTPDPHPSVASLDADKLQYPLRWRAWQDGDHFIPLGMKTHKKLSDLLIDLKVPRHKKARVTVLESAGEIVWVVGYRIAETCKITSATSRILVIKHRVADASSA